MFPSFAVVSGLDVSLAASSVRFSFSCRHVPGPFLSWGFGLCLSCVFPLLSLRTKRLPLSSGSSEGVVFIPSAVRVTSHLLPCRDMAVERRLSFSILSGRQFP